MPKRRMLSSRTKDKQSAGEEDPSKKRPALEVKSGRPKVERTADWSFEWEDSLLSSPEESEEDYLWRKFEHCLKKCGIEPEETDTVIDTTEVKRQECKLEACGQNEDNERLNEEIRIICRVCGRVLKEIGDIYAPFLHP